MEYRKLNESELKELYRNLQGFFGVEKKYTTLTNLVSKYFKDAASILVKVDSEYNDNTYDNRFGGVYVYNAKDIEIPLSRSDRESFTNEVNQIHVPIPEETEESMDDFVIYISKNVPDVYIKVK